MKSALSNVAPGEEEISLANDEEEFGAMVRDTPFERLKRLVRSTGSAVLVSILLGGFVGSLGSFLDSSTSTREQRYEFTAANVEDIRATLQEMQYRLQATEKIVATFPEAVQNLRVNQHLVANALAKLDLGQRIGGEDAGAFRLTLSSPAYAQQVAASPEAETHTLVTYSLIAVVALILILFVLLYMFTKDRAKKAYAEKTITTMVGFIFGLITGNATKR